MNGIEKLTQQINADAQVEIDALLAEGKAKDEAVAAEFAQRAEKAAADILAKDGISLEIIDLRTLYPLDKDMIRSSIAKTHHAIVITEETKRGGYGGEISATIAEEMFDELDGPVVRIGSLNTPVPVSPILEQAFMPNYQDIVNAARKML